MAAKKTSFWNPLNETSRVSLIAPGFRTMPGQLGPAKGFLKGWGLNVDYPKDTFGSHFMMAHSDKMRFKNLKKALLSPSSDGVWCIRGGYGSMRLLPYLDQVKRPKQQKLFIGLSDITSLLLYLKQKWGWTVLHGPTLDRLGSGRVESRELDLLYDIVFGMKTQVEFKGLKAFNSLGKKKSIIKAPITGGNLITLQASIGTPYEIETRGHFLFIEDIGERAYRVDRVLEHLRQAGKLKGIKGLLVGQFTHGNEPGNKRSLVPKAIQEFAQTVDFPVVGGIECGHGYIQRPLPLGPKAQLSLGAKPFLICDTGCAV